MNGLPTELLIESLSHLPLRDLQLYYNDVQLRPYIFNIFFKNILILASVSDETDAEEDDFELEADSTFQFNDGKYIKFNSILSFLKFASNYEDFLNPDTLEVESIWNLFPLYKLYPNLLKKCQNIKINNKSATNIINANECYSNFDNIKAFTINGHTNYQNFLITANEVFSNLRTLGINNVDFDYSLFNTKLPSVNTLEIGDCQIKSLKLIPANLKKLLIKSLPNNYSLSSLQCTNVEELVVGNVDDVDFTRFHHLTALTISSHRTTQLNQLKLPASIESLTIRNSKLSLNDILELPLLKLELENSFFVDEANVDLKNLLSFTYTLNDCQSRINFILPNQLTDLSIKLSQYTNEIGNVHFLNESSAKVEISDDYFNKSYIHLPLDLKNLNLSQNSLTNTHSLQFPPHLAKLNLSQNKLSSFENSNIELLQDLEYLDLSYNDFVDFNNHLHLPNNLRILSLSKNPLVSYSNENNLYQLNLSHISKPLDIHLSNTINSLSLKDVDTSSLNLEHLTQNLGHFAHLPKFNNLVGYNI